MNFGGAIVEMNAKNLSRVTAAYMNWELPADENSSHEFFFLLLINESTDSEVFCVNTFKQPFCRRDETVNGVA